MEPTIHTLGDYLDRLEREGLLAFPLSEKLDRSAKVPLVSYDSREVVPGTLFICKGAHFKEAFLRSAQEQGAAAYVSQTPYPAVDLPCVQVTDLRRAMAHLADLFYNHPSGDLKVIGLTGTKGKSTTAYYLKNILDAYLQAEGRHDSGLVSSIRTYDGVESFTSHMTTPEPLELQRHFAHARGAGMEYLTMEVSSQALKYHRSLCTQFAVTCFLNIGVDHISPIEHPDFEDYFTSKLKIFQQGAVSCVNLDCDHADRVLAAAREAGKPMFTFSKEQEQADVYASNIRKEGENILFRVRTARFDREFCLTMPGLFNVENALAAIAVCEALQIPAQAIYTGLKKARVPGRMEVYSNADGSITAIVDFAHNRMSFETLFRSARSEYPGRRVTAVFGCPGNKALDRRQDLGEVSGLYADRVILTEDDPADEDPEEICREIAPHVAAGGASWSIEVNRGEAIRQAVLECEGPTVLLIAGKGPDTSMKRGSVYVDTPSDGENVQAFLKEYDLRHGLDGMGRIRTLLALLPQLKEVRGRTAVIACGGAEELDWVLEDAAALHALGMEVVLTCGGGERVLSGLARHQAPAVATTEVDGKALKTLLQKRFLPVIITSQPQTDGQTAAEALKARELVLFTRAGSLLTGDDLEPMDRRRARELVENGLVTGMQADQVHGACHAVEAGVGRVSILNGQEEHALLLALLGQRVSGTAITQ